MGTPNQKHLSLHPQFWLLGFFSVYEPKPSPPTPNLASASDLQTQSTPLSFSFLAAHFTGCISPTASSIHSDFFPCFVLSAAPATVEEEPCGTPRPVLLGLKSRTWTDFPVPTVLWDSQRMLILQIHDNICGMSCHWGLTLKPQNGHWGVNSPQYLGWCDTPSPPTRSPLDDFCEIEVP